MAAARGDPFSGRNSCLENRPQAGLGINLAIMANQAAVEVVSIDPEQSANNRFFVHPISPKKNFDE